MFYDLTLPDMQTEAQSPSYLKVKVTTRIKSCPQNMQQVLHQRKIPVVRESIYLSFYPSIHPFMH